MSSIDTALTERLNAGFQSARQKLSRNELSQEAFFQLMIAQFRNQDPTKPFDGQQQLAQLAQFSTVNGIQELQQSFDQLAQSLQSLNALQASSLVGRSVIIGSDKGYVSANQPLQGRVDLTEPVNDLTVTIYDDSGREITRLRLGAQTAGKVEFTWNGLDSNGAQVPPGKYQIKAEGTVAGGKAKNFATQVRAAVQSVALGKNGLGMVINLAGLGAHDISEVLEIL